LSVSVDPRIGSELLGYRVEALLGRGGMGVVYRAYDQRLKRHVALKLIAPELAEDERFRERFLAETEIAASLEHPNVVPIHDAGEVDGQLYLAMRCVDGGELKSLLQREPLLEPAQALAICSQVAAALDAAHARGLVHRDVKPSNVLLDENEHVYLADFGLSRHLAAPGLSEVGLSVGTPAYVSPEQIEGGSVDGRGDQYALGCVLYECLAGHTPFERGSDLAVLWAHVQEPPPLLSARNPALRADIDAVIGAALAKSPDERYRSCGELVDRACDALGLHQRTVARKARWVAGALVAALLIAAAVLAGVLLSQGNGGPPRRPSSAPTLAPKVDSLQRIDPKTNKLEATIPAGAGAASIATGDGAVFVASTDAKTVSRIDPRSNAIVKRVSVGVTPTSIAAGSPQHPALWVVANQDGASFTSCTLSQLDPTTLATNYTSRFGDACGPVVTHGGQTWFGGTGNSLVLVDWGSGNAMRMVPTEAIGAAARGLAVGANALWLASPVTEELLRFDQRGHKRVISTGSGSFPSDVAVGEGGVWVADSANNTVIQIDPSRNRIVRTVRVGGDPVAVAIGSGAVWVANDQGGSVSRIDPITGRVTTFRVGPYPRDIAIGEGGVWVTVHPQNG
jgi:serine/threonine protein kinase